MKSIAIVSVLPLFLLNVFSTYQWICFVSVSSTSYCTVSAPPSSLQTVRIDIAIAFTVVSVTIGFCYKIDGKFKEYYLKCRGSYDYLYVS